MSSCLGQVSGRGGGGDDCAIRLEDAHNDTRA